MAHPSITFPQAAFVLALAAGSVRLIHLTRDGPPLDVPVLPTDAASAAGIASTYRSVNRYPRLAERRIEGSPEGASDAELANGARALLDELYAQELAELRDRFQLRFEQGRASTDVATVAHAATYGAIDTVVVDIDQKVPGVMDEETGAVTFTKDDAASYGVVPGGGAVAAILRYAP